MSNEVNSNLFERAADLLDDFTNHPSGLDKQLEKAVESNDLDEIHRIVTICEGLLAQEHFHELTGEQTDVY